VRDRDEQQDQRGELENTAGGPVRRYRVADAIESSFVTKDRERMKHAAVYARISRRSRTSDDTVAEQQRCGLGVVEVKGWTLVRDGDEDTFTDDGTSASRDDVVRPAFERLVAACQRREVDVIVVRDVDRLSRRDRDWGRLDIPGHALSIADWTGDIMDRLRAGITAQVAAEEARKISERVKGSEGRRVAAGKPPRGGTRAFGYDREHQIVEDEAKLIRELARRYLPPDPEPLRSLCKWLEDQGVRSPVGKPWQPSNLRNMLRSPRLTGLRTHHGQVFEGTWEAILDRETHRALVSMRGGPVARQATTWMLTGVIWCGRCGGRLTGNRSVSTSPRRRYICRKDIGKACGLSAEKHSIERHVWDRALDEAWQVDERDQESSKTLVAAARQTLVECQRRLATIDERYTRGQLEEARWVELGDAAQREVEAARAQVREAEDRERSIPMWWRLLALDDAGADEGRRRSAIQGVVRRVTVHPTTMRGRFDPDRVEIEWR
jgi:site-specific DNA recombinase